MVKSKKKKEGKHSEGNNKKNPIISNIKSTCSFNASTDFICKMHYMYYHSVLIFSNQNNFANAHETVKSSYKSAEI